MDDTTKDPAPDNEARASLADATAAFRERVQAQGDKPGNDTDRLDRPKSVISGPDGGLIEQPVAVGRGGDIEIKQPTIGRILHIHRPGPSGPSPAIVTAVDGPLVDVTVFEAGGATRAFSQVPHMERSRAGDACCWTWPERVTSPT